SPPFINNKRLPIGQPVIKYNSKSGSQTLRTLQWCFPCYAGFIVQQRYEVYSNRISCCFVLLPFTS
ncbi:hypothetical protein ACI3PF_18805, partial [Lactococcus lactis]